MSVVRDETDLRCRGCNGDYCVSDAMCVHMQGRFTEDSLRNESRCEEANPIIADKLIDSNRVSGYTSFDREVPSADRDVCRSSQI
jgi:hypothetical protein